MVKKRGGEYVLGTENCSQRFRALELSGKWDGVGSEVYGDGTEQVGGEFESSRPVEGGGGGPRMQGQGFSLLVLRAPYITGLIFSTFVPDCILGYG